MDSRRSRPLGAALSALAALVFATPTLFLPADAHASVKLVFIVGGSALFAFGVIRVRAEGAETREPRDDRPLDGAPPPPA
ncbi:hypothetical protein [Microbacterium testaceum]|uniref:Uncharacterized protein n=1 Tax=Microbacterium testaceum TaxID=2033 RepID=A0A147F8S5_MICTE|nr:hypothetical protein [Microbacterium testaceum]KTS12905.1 hypothetical protein RSA3_07400 [Microbacterium testaceum]